MHWTHLTDEPWRIGVLPANALPIAPRKRARFGSGVISASRMRHACNAVEFKHAQPTKKSLKIQTEHLPDLCLHGATASVSYNESPRGQCLRAGRFIFWRQQASG